MTVELIKSTRQLNQINIVWDAVIIGAGPAGSFAAIQLAGDRKILLLDKAQFPRAKVCGCCLNGAACATLARAGLSEIFTQSGAVPLRALELHHGSEQALLSLPAHGYALSRNFLDAFLIKKAVSLGADFVCGVTAKVNAGAESALVTIDLTAADYCATIESKLVIVADGLNGHALDRINSFAVQIEKDARFGCGTIIEGAQTFAKGRVYMCCHPAGYVGLVALEDGRHDLAAALDIEFSRQCGGPARAAEAVFKYCRFTLPAGFNEAIWHGTEALTRKRERVAGHRIFVIGDSCGYPEPFTGEGMAWALQSAEAVALLAKAAIIEWKPHLIADWQTEHEKLIGGGHHRSKFIAYSLRNGMLCDIALPVLKNFPFIGEAVLANLSGSSDKRIAFGKEIHC